MSDNDKFKTPKPLRTLIPTIALTGATEYFTPRGNSYQTTNGKAGTSSSTSSNNDNNQLSDESTSSSQSVAISLVADFDDYTRYVQLLKTDHEEYRIAYSQLLGKTRQLFSLYSDRNSEVQSLVKQLENKKQQCNELECVVHQARRILDQERVTLRTVKKERNDLMTQFAQIREFLCDGGKFKEGLPSDTKDRLSFLNTYDSYEAWDANRPQQPLDTIKEVNSTGSILSDFSYSRSEDSLDDSVFKMNNAWKKHRPSTDGIAEPVTKRRKSSAPKTVEINATDTVRATTTLTMTKEGPIQATSIIESIPQNVHLEPTNTPINSKTSTPKTPQTVWSSDEQRSCSNKTLSSLKPHNFQQKMVLMKETCNHCEKRINIGKSVLKCKDCKSICHIECKDSLPLPCYVSSVHRNYSGTIGDYTPTVPPMVPALLIYCINEIEMRGLTTLGLYRVPGAEHDVKLLKEKFLRGRGAPNLSEIDVCVLCSTVKDFLRGLSEALITCSLRKSFIQASEDGNSNALCCCISSLPQPNRDSLAYMMLHLQKVASSDDCKMPVDNLSKIFGPTIIGFSSKTPDLNSLHNESCQQIKLLATLMKLPSEYWSSFIHVENRTPNSNGLQQTPSTDSLLRSVPRKTFTFTPRSANKHKIQFPSPKMKY